MTMRVALVFLDWRKKGVSVSNTEEGVELTMGDFHGGSTFFGNIELDANDEAELLAAIKAGYQPCWWMGEAS